MLRIAPWLALLALAACGQPEATPAHLDTDPHPFDAVVGRSWVVVEVGEEATLTGQPATIEFVKGGKLTAFSGLNRVQAQWFLEGMKLGVTSISSTEVEATEERVRQDEAFLDALDRIDGWAFDEEDPDVLYLLEGEDPRLTLEHR